MRKEKEGRGRRVESHGKVERKGETEGRDRSGTNEEIAGGGEKEGRGRKVGSRE